MKRRNHEPSVVTAQVYKNTKKVTPTWKKKIVKKKNNRDAADSLELQHYQKKIVPYVINSENWCFETINNVTGHIQVDDKVKRLRC